MRDWATYVRARLEAERTSPQPHPEAIDELAAHLNDVYQAALARGLDTTGAIAAAEAELAGMRPLASALDRRAHRTFFNAPAARRRLWDGLAGDARHAMRLMRQRPGVSVLAAVMLALGIGVATTIFGIYDAVVLASMPYPDASRLVLLWEGGKSDPDDTYIVAAPVYEDWRARTRTLDSLGIWEFVSFNVAAVADPEQVAGIRASASLFDTIGVPPAMGRTFTADEDAQGARVAVISDTVWRSHFAADPHVVGRHIRLNDVAYDVVGVLPAGYAFPRRATGIYVPMSYSARDRERSAHSFYVMGRMKPDVTFDQVRDDFARIGEELAKEFPANADETSRPTKLADFGMATLRRMLTALGCASAFVLLIACVNVANLLIAGAIDRRREFGLRRALGAGSGRLSRQLLMEGLALAGLGTAGGMLVAWIGTRTLDLLLGSDFLTFWFRGRVSVALDASALGFAVAAGAITALLFSFAPLAGLRRILPALSDGARGVARSALGLRRVLVATEVALAIVVLCAAGLLVKSFAALLHVNPGVDPDRVLTLQLSLPQEDTYGPAVRTMFCEDITAAAAGGSFTALGAISHLPFSGSNAGRGLSIEGRPHDPENPVNANYRVVCPGYFRALGIPFVRGRDVAATDRAPVIVINRAMAERYWKDENPVGQRLRIGRSDGPAWMTIVGVAENAKHFGLDAEPSREIFVPYRQNVWPVMTVVAKTSGPITPTSSGALRDAMRRAFPGVPATAVRTMDQFIEGSVSWRKSFMRLLLVFAMLGLGLSAVGVYGVLAYFVSQRSREIGIRVALGARRPAIVRLVLRQSLIPIVAGIVAGSLASIWSGRLLTDLLFRTEPGDPLVIATMTTLVLTVGIAASWAPAHRAAGVDATVALRRE